MAGGSHIIALLASLIDQTRSPALDRSPREDIDPPNEAFVSHCLRWIDGVCSAFAKPPFRRGNIL